MVNYWQYILFAILSILFLLVFSSNTSPLINFYGGDSPVFILMGKMLNAGKIPYVEIFDHKGPTLIFIEAIGLKLTGNDRLSIFILQVVNLFITQVFIYKIAKTYLPQLISIAVVMLSLLAFSFTIQGGNLTEEWSLPYLYLCLLLTIRLDNYSIARQKIYFAIIGISASILFWMRLNNTGLICACMLFILIITLRYKDWKRISNLILWFTIGFLLVSIPIIGYFNHIGAFSEMIYASFTFNFKYAGYAIEDQPFKIIDPIKSWLSLFVFVTGTVLYYIRYKDYKIVVLCICLLSAGFFSTHIGPQYFHYMTLNLPLFSLGTIQIFAVSKDRLSSRNNRILIFTSSLLLLSSYTLYKINQKQYIKDQDDSVFIQNSTEIIKRIPAEQRSSIFAYNVPARFWLIANTLPNYKFFTKQEWHGEHDATILEETNRLICQRPPIWIILPNLDVFDKSVNPQFYDTLSKDYEENYRNSDLILMKRKVNL